MEDKVLAEILSAHADQLKRGRGKESDYLAMFPDYQEELRPLLGMAERIKGVLEPVEPTPEFCQSLYEDLLVAGHGRPDEGVPQLATSHRKQIFIRAAAVGSVVSLAGALYLMRSRADAEAQSGSAA